MSTPIKKVAIAGASGILGRPILHALLEANFEVTVLTRTTSTANFDPHPHMQVARIDYTLEALTHVLRSHDALVSTVGVAGIQGQREFVDAIETAGVPRFIVSEFAYPPETHGLPELEFSRTIKREIMQYLHDRATANVRFSWTAIATGLPFDSVIQRFPQAFGFDIARHHARIYDGGTEPFTASTLAGIARAVVGVLKHPDETANRFLRVRSLQTSQSAILKEFEHLTQTAWTITHEDSATVREQANLKLKAGTHGATAELVAVQLFAKGGGRSLVATKETNDNSLLGVEEEELSPILERVLKNY